jgi:exodeoxyribonuclease V alpha subunit
MTARPPDPVADGRPVAEEDDPFRAGLALRSTGLMRQFNQAGLLDAADVHVARRVGELGGEPDERVLLALALAVQAVRAGSVCLDLAVVPALDPELPWPDPADWAALVRASPLTTDLDAGADVVDADDRPLRWDGDRLYLDRYWRDECDVCADLLARELASPPSVDEDRLRDAVLRHFPAREQDDPAAVEFTRAAATTAATHWTAVLGGGPGTGKTTTVARLLAVLADLSPRPPRIALAAPTGKAAARLTEAVARVVDDFPAELRERLGPLTASTLHRLLGTVPGSRSTFRSGRDNRLPHDVVVVDEASMISLTMMARLLAALRPDTRLILVGDPHQLASVDAGAVLADLGDGLRTRSPASSGVVLLQHNWRFGGRIADLAAAVRAGDAAAALAICDSGADDVALLVPDDVEAVRADVVTQGLGLRAAADAGDADGALRALDGHRVLCGHRTGPAGVEWWRRRIEGWLAAAHAGPDGSTPWYPGRPLLVMANDYGLGLFNGDTGVVIRDHVGRATAVFARGPEQVRFRPSRLGAVESVHAMTVHRSQGSQFGTVSLMLPEPESPLLTRELLYTAITRAQHRVRVVGSREALVKAVERPAARASGLRRRLERG